MVIIVVLVLKVKEKMKKIISVLAIGLLLVVLPSVVWGQDAEQVQKKVRDPTTHETETTVGSEGSQVQNQVQTQNAGEDQNLQVSTQEGVSESGVSSSQSRSAVAREKMSAVARGVEELLTEREDADAKGGIGQQVRVIAQEQKDAQAEIAGQAEKLEARSGFVKKLFGPDYKAIKSLNQQMERNQLRIEQLEQLQTEIANEGDQEQVQGVVQALVEQNTALQEQIQAEEEVGSLFGWLFKLFAN